jgi:hypothetical protein
MSPLIKRGLVAGVLAALSIPGGARAQPMRDASTSGKPAVHWQHRLNASHPSITFTPSAGRGAPARSRPALRHVITSAPNTNQQEEP